MNIDVSIIIVNYNTRQLTLETIDSVIERTEGVNYEIILVDNASTDGSRELFSQDDRITYLYGETNLGFGRANNKGVEIANGRNILFLNPDTLLINNAVKILSDELDSDERIGIIGGNLYNAEGKECHSHYKFLPGIRLELNRLLFGFLAKVVYKRTFEHNYTSSNIEVAHITGADLMMSKELFLRVGGFNPIFFMYYEETELCFRVNKLGYKIINTPKSKITHLEGASFSSQASLNRLERIWKGRSIYYILTQTKLKKHICDTISSVSLYERLLFYIIRSNKPMIDLQKARITLFKDIINADSDEINQHLV